VRDVALSLGVDIGPQLAALELGLDDIAPTSNKYLPANKVTQLLERCAKLCNAPDFGLRVGEAQDISVLGPIALAIVHAPSGRSAFEAARRNLHLLSLAWRLDVRDHAEAETESFIALRSLAGRRPQSAERMLVFIHRVLGWVTAQGYAPRAVWLQHQPISPLSRYRSAFGVTPLFGMPELGIAVANSQLDATDPESYGLPKDPTIPWAVSHWQGPVMWLGSLVLAGGVLGSFFHYLRYGPKPTHDEANLDA
jgi:hypothetical protein